MVMTHSKSILRDEVVVPKPIEPSERHLRWPLMSESFICWTTSAISNGSALKSVFPSCSMRLSLDGGTAQNTTNPLRSRSRATLLVKGSVVTPVITALSLCRRERIPTASFRCPLAKRFARLFLPISLAFRLTIIPVTIAPLPRMTTATSTLFLLSQFCKRSSVAGSCGGDKYGSGAAV